MLNLMRNVAFKKFSNTVRSSSNSEQKVYKINPYYMNTIRLARQEDIEQIKKLYQETILSVNIKDYTFEQVDLWAKRGVENDVWLQRMYNII